MYTTAGVLQADWALHSVNANPRGITIDPAGVSTSVWVVDSGTSKVYEYDRDNGELRDIFALDRAAGNTAPRGIADPPATARVPSVLLPSEPAAAVRESRLVAAAAPPLTSTRPFSSSLAQKDARHDQQSLEPDASDSDLGVEDTTMFVSPSPPTIVEPHTEPAAADAAIEEVEVGALDDQLVEDLAIALL
jgi:hypothetical protein